MQNTTLVIFYVYLGLSFFVFTALVPTTIFVWQQNCKDSTDGILYGPQRELRWFLLAVTVYLILNNFGMLVSSDSTTYFVAAISYACLTAVPTWWFLFALEFYGKSELSRRLKRYLWIVPVVSPVVALLNGRHGLIWATWYILRVGPFSVLRATSYGAFFWFVWPYLQILTLSGSVLVFVSIFSRGRFLNRQSLFIILGTAFPIFSNVIYVLRIIPAMKKDFSPAAFGISGLVLVVGVFYDRLFDLVPIARRALVEALEDPLIAVDADDRIVDANSAAVIACALPQNLHRFWISENAFLRDIAERCSESSPSGLEASPDGRHWFEVRVCTVSAGKRRLSLYSMRDVTERRRLLQEKTALADRLSSAMSEIKTLKGIIPICSSCKKIRDDSGYWLQVESYIATHTGAEFSHGICPDCRRRLYPDIEEPHAILTRRKP